MNNIKEFTVWGEDLEELNRAVEKVDCYMNRKIGDNVIIYRIIGEEKPQPWDSGYITDEALEELQQGFIIVKEETV